MKLRCPSCHNLDPLRPSCALCGGTGCITPRELDREPDVVDLGRLDESVMDTGWRDETLALVREAHRLLMELNNFRAGEVLRRVEQRLLAAAPPGIVEGRPPGRPSSSPPYFWKLLRSAVWEDSFPYCLW
jgi:hypothetical protein